VGLVPTYDLLPVLASLQTNDGDGSFETLSLGVPLVVAFLDPGAVIPAGQVIDSLSIVSCFKDPSANGDVVQAGLRSGAVDSYGQAMILDATGYFAETEDPVLTVDPSDGGLWTIAKLTAARLLALASSVITSGPRCTLLKGRVVTHSGPGGPKASGSTPSSSTSVSGSTLNNTAASGSAYDVDAEGES
jgi:hypothetical protein